MRHHAAAWFGLLLLSACIATIADSDPDSTDDRLARELRGTWAGTVEQSGESRPIALTFEPDSGGRVAIAMSWPALHLDHYPIGVALPSVVGDSLRIGSFRFAYDRAAGRLDGRLTSYWAPAHDVPLRLARADGFTVPPRPELPASSMTPLWTFDAGSPSWAGPAYGAHRVFAGCDDGVLHALDAGTGRERWRHATGGAIRSRPVLLGPDVVVQSDDGWLYRIGASDGRLKWRVKVADAPYRRLPASDPATRYDRFAADVAVAGGVLYVGTGEGKVLALDPADGRRKWAFATGGPVLAAVAIGGGKVFAGSFDHAVYALDSGTGRLLWKRDTGGVVVSTPAFAGDRVIVGNRIYDLLGLDAGSGDVTWRRYVWKSWIESSASIREGIAYIGSSDAAVVDAVNAADGRLLWRRDVWGWAWGQPLVSANRVVVGVAGQVDYPIPFVGSLLSLDRATGQVRWRYACPVPARGDYGFPGSVAAGDGRVYAAALDGTVRAFAE